MAVWFAVAGEAARYSSSSSERGESAAAGQPNQPVRKDARGRALLSRGQCEAWARAATREDNAGFRTREMSAETVLQRFSVADRDNDGFISFPEFCRAWFLYRHAAASAGSGALAAHGSGGGPARVQYLFELLDCDSSGFVSKAELAHFVQRLLDVRAVPEADAVTHSMFGFARAATAEEVAARWMARFDVDEDGRISRAEFDRMAAVVDFSKAQTTSHEVGTLADPRINARTLKEMIFGDESDY